MPAVFALAPGLAFAAAAEEEAPLFAPRLALAFAAAAAAEEAPLFAPRVALAFPAAAGEEAPP